MADGTLLGSYFFHDIIPWDDDMDIMVDYQDYPRLKKAFQNETIWSKYNLCGFHDSFNEYEFHIDCTLTKLFRFGMLSLDEGSLDNLP